MCAAKNRMSHILVSRSDTDSPKGCTDGIVAMRSVRNRQVVAHVRTVKNVLKKAARAGALAPALMFVPRLGARYIY